MRIAIVKESSPDETRVAGSPETVGKLVERGHEVVVESTAGLAAGFTDATYREAGATVIEDGPASPGANVVFRVNAPTDDEISQLDDGATLVSFVWPAQRPELLEKLAAKKLNVFAMDQVPRITRAQKMDALSSMANIAGYRAVIEAAERFGSFFSGQITAAGRTRPAHVLIIGAGVAGLAAIAAARGLGAVVYAFDTRSAVKEQVESLGANFLQVEIEESGEGGGGYAKVMSQEFIDAEMALFREYAPKTDVIITTALIPGKPAPKLILADMVEMMPRGGVVVDLAAEQGGNCELTRPNETVVEHGVSIVGATNLPTRLPNLASRLYATNVYNLFDELLDDEELAIDLDDPVHRGAIVLEKGEMRWPPPKITDPSPPPPPAEPAPAPATSLDAAPPPRSGARNFALLAVVGALLVWIGLQADAKLLQQLTVFLLACVVGWHVVWNVTAALHTPLMSVTNAISGIILIGGMLLVKPGPITAATILGVIAVLVATINAAGGFLVTQRMLKMFRK